MMQKNTPVSSDGWALACSAIILPVEVEITEAPQGQANKKKSRH
jgi:hypothetical protein